MINFFKKENKLSWEEQFGFSFLRECQNSTQEFFRTYYTQCLDSLELMRDMPLSTEKIESYSQENLNRIRQISQVHFQSLQAFEDTGSSFHSWNSIAKMIEDVSPLWASNVKVELAESSVGFDLKRSRASSLVMGLAHILMKIEFSNITIKVKIQDIYAGIHLSFDAEEFRLDQGIVTKSFGIAWLELLKSCGITIREEKREDAFHLLLSHKKETDIHVESTTS